MNGIHATARQSMILQTVQNKGRVWTLDLQKQFNVTKASIWKDLKILEENGSLIRIHGGAIPNSGTSRIELFNKKMQLHLKEKELIGKAAVSLIHPHDVCLMDSGTTTFQIIRNMPFELRQQNAITLVTNSIPIALEVLTWPLPNLILLGGIYLPEYQASVGSQTLKQLNELTANIVFLGTDGITIEEGVTTANILMAEVDRLMVERSRRVILVTDSSKLGISGFTIVKSLKAIDMIITDSSAPKYLISSIEDQGIKVMLV